MKIPQKPFLFFLTAQVYDVSMTRYLLSSGLGVEANPIMAHLIDLFGLSPGLLIGKGAGVLLIVAVLKRADTPVVLSERFRLTRQLSYALYGMGVLTVIAGSVGYLRII